MADNLVIHMPFTRHITAEALGRSSELADILGVPSTRAHEWLAVALLHPSAIAELVSEPDGLADVSAALRELGSAVLQLSMLDVVVARHPDADRQSLSLTLQRTGALAEAVWDGLGLGKRVILGRGELRTQREQGPTRAVIDTTVRKLYGALQLGGDYKAASDLTRRFLPAELMTNGADTNLKSYLQERIAPNIPVYELIDVTGPDNRRQYTYRCSTPDGRSAVGSGRSKKLASTAAAERYIFKYLGEPASSTERYGKHLDPPRALRNDDPRLPPKHRKAVATLAIELGCTGERAAEMFTEALTHSSWAQENRVGPTRPRDYGTLARIGAEVANVLFRQEYLSTLVSVGRAPRHPITSAMSADRLAPLSERLGLTTAVLLGRGQREAVLPTSVMADATQAVLGVAFRVQKAELFRAPPAPLNWWARNLVQTATTDPLLDSKTLLQQLLEPLDVGVTYEATIQGPEHARVFRTIATLASTDGSLSFRGAPASSRKAADQQVARPIARVVRAATRGWTPQLAELLETSDYAASVARLVLGGLNRQLENGKLPGTSGRAQAIATMASSVSDSRSFLQWVLWSSRLLGGEALGEVGGWQRALLSVQNGFARDTSDLLDELRYVARWVGSLEVSDAEEATSAPEFDRLLAIALALRLVRQPVHLVAVNDAISDWLIVQPQQVSIEVAGLDSVIGRSLVEPVGAIGTVLSRLTAHPALDRFILSVQPEDADRIRVTLETDSPLTRGPVDALLGLTHRLLGVESHVHEANLTVVCFAPMTDSAHAMLPAIQAIVTTYARSLGMANWYASVVHDIKNQISAAQIAVNARPGARTADLQAEHTASRHLDEAQRLTQVLQLLASEQPSYRPVEFDFGKWLRHWTAEKIPSIPSGFRIIPPALATAVVSTDVSAVQSILENLLKNSLEAMREGDVVLTLATASEGVTLTLSDAGGGLPEELETSIQAGRALATTKSDGSGLGIWSSIRTAAALGGELTYTRLTDVGSKWTLSLPNGLQVGGGAAIGEEDLLTEDWTPEAVDLP